jgi:hypothetical protein
MNGITLPMIGDQAVRYLRAHGISAGDAGVTSNLVDSAKRGLARLSLRVDAFPAAPGRRAARAASKDPIRNNVGTVAADASRRAALLVAYILPVCAVLAPCRAGASTPSVTTLFLTGS